MSGFPASAFAEFSDPALLDAARRYAADYLATALDRRATPGAEDMARLGNFDEPFPATGRDGLAILAQLHRDGAPATIPTIGGRHFGLVNGGALPAAVAARWLADIWDQNGVMAAMSPVAAKLESVCEAWLRQIFGLQDEWVAGFVSGSSIAILCGLAAGRERALANRGWDVNARGLNGAPPIRIVAGRHAHASVLRALALLGLGTATIEWVDVDDQGRIVANAVPALDDATLLILQAGNVNSGAFDTLEPLCRRAREAGAWVHVDGAFGLWAGASPRLAHLVAGAELADSWSLDGHKTVNTPYDCGIVMCRDAAALARAMRATDAPYLAQGGGRNAMHYAPEMSRRARAIDLWAALSSLGADGLDALVWQLHERAAQMAEESIAAGFEILNEVAFNQVLIGCGDAETTRRIAEHVRASGECWIGDSLWFGQPVLRFSVCSWATTPADISRAAAALAAARAVAN